MMQESDRMTMSIDIPSDDGAVPSYLHTSGKLYDKTSNPEPDGLFCTLRNFPLRGYVMSD